MEAAGELLLYRMSYAFPELPDTYHQLEPDDVDRTVSHLDVSNPENLRGGGRLKRIHTVVTLDQKGPGNLANGWK